MKRILYIMMLSVLSSCSEFLNEEPRSEFAENTYFQTVAQLKSSVVGAYATMRSIYAVATNTPLFVSFLGTDELLFRGTSNVRADIDRYGYTSSNGCVEETWIDYYELITIANTVIDKGEAMEVDSD